MFVDRMGVAHPRFPIRGSKVIAEAFGYTADELKSLPEEANLGLSCGNPTAIAKLEEVS